MELRERSLVQKAASRVQCATETHGSHNCHTYMTAFMATICRWKYSSSADTGILGLADCACGRSVYRFIFLIRVLTTFCARTSNLFIPRSAICNITRYASRKPRSGLFASRRVICGVRCTPNLDTFTCGRHHGERGGKFYVAIMRTADNAYQMGRSL